MPPNMASDSNKKEQGVIFHLSGTGLTWWVIPLPIFGAFLCVALSLIFNFEEATSSECHDGTKVPNYLPSISSAIGGFTPQKYIWRICIAVTCAPRYMQAIMHYNHYKAFPVQRCRRLFDLTIRLASWLHITEISCMVIVTFVSSTENYPIHEKAFIGFVVSSQLYMILTLLAFRWARQGQTWSPKDTKSFRVKFVLFLVNISSFAMASYFFLRHMARCERGMYTGFATFEYLIVSSNSAFHSSWMLTDLGDAILKVHAPVERGEYRMLPMV